MKTPLPYRVVSKLNKKIEKTYGRSHRYLICLLLISYVPIFTLIMFIVVASKSNFSFAFQDIIKAIHQNVNQSSGQLFYDIGVTIITILLYFQLIFKWTTMRSDYRHPYLFESKANLYFWICLVIIPLQLSVAMELSLDWSNLNQINENTFVQGDYSWDNVVRFANDIKNLFKNSFFQMDMYFTAILPFFVGVYLWSKGMDVYHPTSDKWKFVRWIWNVFKWIWQKWNNLMRRLFPRIHGL